MNLKVRLGGRAVELRLSRNGQEWRFRAQPEQGDAIEKAASVLEVEPGVYSILFEGRSLEARVERAADGLVVNIGARRFVVEVEDPRRPGKRPKSFHGEGPRTVMAPMPGKVVRVLVAEGDRVEAGQGLLVVEAMKMQNEMKAPKTGRVVLLSAREGATVGAGEILASIE